jgi:hypothetical protein
LRYCPRTSRHRSRVTLAQATSRNQRAVIAMTSQRVDIVCGPTMTARLSAATIGRGAESPPTPRKETLMTQADVSTRFEKISDNAKAATNHLKAAGQKTKDQLESEIASARDRATAKADQIKGKTDVARDEASSQWHELRDKWHAHVAKMREDIEKKKDQYDAHEAANDADRAQAYAADAIDFALDAIDEAEYAALDAVYLRATADALNS